MKPNFNEMTRAELLTYVKSHRDDSEAWGIYLDRRSPDETATWYSFPSTPEGLKQEEEVLRLYIQEIGSRQPPAA